MFTIHDHTTAVFLCVITMLGWGSWANTLKISSARGWPFELFYWDYAIGMGIASSLIALTFGSHGAGTGAIDSLRSASQQALLAALFSGVLFNASNVLIVIAADLAGIAVAFPIAVGLAVVIGTAVTYWQSPAGNALLLFSGLGVLLGAMLLAALASNQQKGAVRARSLRGLLFAVLSGSIMGFFYPRLAASMNGPGQGIAGRMTPYAAAVVFTAGLLLSNLVINTILMKARGARYSTYFSGTATVHLAGVLGGCIWMVALMANVVAASVAGAAVSYALGQGATLVAALWGVFIWREFRGCSRATKFTLGAMFASYICGLAMIGSAAL